MSRLYILGLKNLSQGDSGEACGSVYDLSKGCPNCGTGVQLISNLIVKGISKVSKEVFITMDGDHLIGKQLFEKMELMGVKFGALPQVENTKAGILPYYNLRPAFFLPKWSSKTIGFEILKQEQCEICNQNCYFNIPHVDFHLYYDRLSIKLLEQSDIFSTWEHWGYSFKKDGRHSLKYSRPTLIVTEKFKNSIEEIGLKYVLFSPITVDKWV